MFPKPAIEALRGLARPGRGEARPGEATPWTQNVLAQGQSKAHGDSKHIILQRSMNWSPRNRGMRDFNIGNGKSTYGVCFDFVRHGVLATVQSLDLELHRHVFLAGVWP